VYCRSRW